MDNDVNTLHAMLVVMVGMFTIVAARSPRHMTLGLSRLRR
jgi:hypothetical protein